jgi:hypothetical protein
MNHDDLISADVRAALLKEGWTVKARRIDKDPAKPILGFRLTNCEALFKKALSVQIFDRSTVSLSIGFSNDEHISLTEDDGRDFLEWLRQFDYSTTGSDDGVYLPDELWNQLGNAIPRADQIEVINMEKARLVEYLVQNSPQTFGRFGTIGAHGGDFYNELLDLVKDPARDESIDRRMIHELESAAHHFYAEANAWLRIAANRTAEADPQILKVRAYAVVCAADEMRERALSHRLRLDEPPAESPFPEAIDAVDLAKIVNAALPGEMVAPGDAVVKLKNGDMVAVSDGESPYFRRMGEVTSASGQVIVVAFPGSPVEESEFKRPQLLYLSSK